MRPSNRTFSSVLNPDTPECRTRTAQMRPAAPRVNTANTAPMVALALGTASSWRRRRRPELPDQFGCQRRLISQEAVQ